MKIKVALIQMSMEKDYDENIAKVDYFLDIAARNGAKLVLIPELFTRPYFCQVEDYNAFDLAEEAENSKTIAHYQQKAQELGLIIPVSFFEKDQNCYFNSLALIDADGEVKGIYRKSHIPTGACYEERFYFAPGDTGFKVFPTEIGNIGVGVCWDQWFPETARILALKGADILLYPTAIGSEPVLPKDSKNHWQNVMRGHAAANIIPVMAANRVGMEMATGSGISSSMKFFGSSFITDEYGQTIAEADREEEALLFAEFDFDAIRKARRDWGVFRDRRTDLYAPILELAPKN